MKIDKFQGKYRWLSNFWLVPIVLDGYVYPSTENAYQTAKQPEHIRSPRFLTISPSAAKTLGQEVEMRDDWDDIKLEVMMKVTQQKFIQGSYLAEKLIATGDVELIEGNTWRDTFWGVCDGVGENHLGKILMKHRDYLNGCEL